MDIDILQGPPVDVLATKKKYQRIIPFLSVVIAIAVLLAVYLVVFDAPSGDFFENTALVLFVAPAFVLFYFAEKLHDYKVLSPEQEQEVEGFCSTDPDIDAYCAKVATIKRKLVKAEYDAFKAWLDERER